MIARRNFKRSKTHVVISPCYFILIRNHLECNHLERNHLEHNHLECNHLECNHLERNHLECNHLQCNHLECNHLERNYLQCNHLQCNHLQCVNREKRVNTSQQHLQTGTQLQSSWKCQLFICSTRTDRNLNGTLLVHL